MAAGLSAVVATVLSRCFPDHERPWMSPDLQSPVLILPTNVLRYVTSWPKKKHGTVERLTYI